MEFDLVREVSQQELLAPHRLFRRLQLINSLNTPTTAPHPRCSTPPTLPIPRRFSTGLATPHTRTRTVDYVDRRDHQYVVTLYLAAF
jgi:hypothetical protein